MTKVPWSEIEAARIERLAKDAVEREREGLTDRQKEEVRVIATEVVAGALLKLRARIVLEHGWTESGDPALPVLTTLRDVLEPVVSEVMDTVGNPFEGDGHGRPE